MTLLKVIDNPFILILTKKGRPFYPLPFSQICSKFLFSFWILFTPISQMPYFTYSLSFSQNKNRPQKWDLSSHFQGLFPSFILFLGIKLFALFRINYFALEYIHYSNSVHIIVLLTATSCFSVIFVPYLRNKSPRPYGYSDFYYQNITK